MREILDYVACDISSYLLPLVSLCSVSWIFTMESYTDTIGRQWWPTHVVVTADIFNSFISTTRLTVIKTTVHYDNYRIRSRPHRRLNGCKYNGFQCSTVWRICLFALATVPSRRYRSLAATVPSSLDGNGSVKIWRYRSRRGYGAVNTISFSLSVTRLVLTPALTLNDPLRPNFTTAKYN